MSDTQGIYANKIMKQFDFKKAFKQYIAKNMKMGSCHSMKYRKTLEMSINSTKRKLFIILKMSLFIFLLITACWSL